MTVEFRVGDVRELLAELPAGSVDLIATSWPYLAQRDYLPADHPMKRYEIGQESTPAEFISTLLEVTAEFRRVLAPHGSIATELGDGFSGSGGNGDGGLTMSRRRDRVPVPRNRRGGGQDGWPLERSLVMAPELYRVALAYGVHPLTGEPSPAGRWRVRNVVVHGRPNPPVGALGGKYRPACSYWAVACTGRRWFDLDGVRHTPKKPDPRTNVPMNKMGVPERGNGGDARGYMLHKGNEAGAPPLDWFEDEGDQFERDLWTLPTSPYPGSHYATFSPELIRRFIVSMCPPRVCLTCGKGRGGTGDQCRCDPTYCSSCDKLYNHGTQRNSNGRMARSASNNVRVVQQNLPAEVLREAPPILLKEVFVQVDRHESNGEDSVQGPSVDDQRLHRDLPAGPPQCSEERLHHGTPLGDGGTLRSSAESGGSSPSPERPEGRQPAGELGTPPEARARPNAEASPTTFPMSALRRHDSDQGHSAHPCPQCGGRLELPPSRVGVTLDPFGGSGTTGMVAAGNGRDCILFDLDERCEALARERIGLYLEELAKPQPEPPAPEHEQEAML